MKAAIYVRVSDDKLKTDGERRQDIQRQTEKLRNYANAVGTPVLEEDVYADDNLSAFKEDYSSRPAFVKLLREIRGHHYQRVYVEDLTRWARRIDDGLKTLKEASDAGCTITSLMEGEIDTTSAAGWFRAAVALMLAEWASRSMSEKVTSGMARRAADQRRVCHSCGVIHMGRHPLSCQCLKCRAAITKKG